MPACSAERLGLKVVEVPSHPREGLNLAALEQLLNTHPVRACLFMLNYANPTGACVPDDGRRQLMALLDRHDVPLIEDDVYVELHHGEQAPLCSKALDRDGRVMHVSSFSKCLAPGFRVGWVAAAHAPAARSSRRGPIGNMAQRCRAPKKVRAPMITVSRYRG